MLSLCLGNRLQAYCLGFLFIYVFVCEESCTCVVKILGVVSKSCWIPEITAVGSLLIGVSEMELKYSGRAASILNL